MSHKTVKAFVALEMTSFFKAALKREWGPDRAIRIPEETPLLMGYYVEHLYGGPLLTHKLSSGPKVLDPDQSSYELLATLYVLGERMLDSYYRNKIILEFLRLLRHGYNDSWPGSKAIRTIYQGTTAGSPARRLMTDFAVHYAYPKVFAEGFAAADPGYLHDVGTTLLKRIVRYDFRMIASHYTVREEA